MAGAAAESGAPEPVDDASVLGRLERRGNVVVRRGEAVLGGVIPGNAERAAADPCADQADRLQVGQGDDDGEAAAGGVLGEAADAGEGPGTVTVGAGTQGHADVLDGRGAQPGSVLALAPAIAQAMSEQRRAGRQRI